MARLQRRSFTESDDVRELPSARVDIVELDDRVVGRMTYQPGWKWSTHERLVAGTHTCQLHHVGVTLSGLLRVEMKDGVNVDLEPGDVFEIPPGHDAWVIGAEAWVAVDFEAARGLMQTVSTDRVLTSILFTDIVDSTSKAVVYGAGRWRDIVARHNEIAERVVDRHGGRVVKTTGDGVIAVFDSSERAVGAAAQLADAVAVLDIAIRAAVHAGEVEHRSGDVRGVAVHVAARMMALAKPGDVLVSRTVHDVLESSELALEDYGEHELKGLPGSRRLYRLARRPGRNRPLPASAH